MTLPTITKNACTNTKTYGKHPSMDAASALESLTGSIERITFHNEENGFCILKIKAKGHAELVTVLGTAAMVNVGAYVDCQGQWINDIKFGLQFRAQQLTLVPPSSLVGIEKYLASGLLKGVGPFMAKQLVNAFKQDIFDVIENHPEKLLKVPGIGKKRQEILVNSWEDQKIIRDIMVFLQTHGVGTARAVRIYNTYGKDAIKIVSENPYRLALDIRGIGFKSADLLAQQLGLSPNSLIRAQAGVRHVIQEFSSEGHCAMPRDLLKVKTAELLEISTEIIEEGIILEVNEGNLQLQEIDGGVCLYLSALFHAELSVAKHIKRLMKVEPPWFGIDLDKAIPWVEETTQMKLSPSQKDSIKTTINNKVVIITGGPGVGKTTIVNSIIKILKAKRIRILLAAPTGRAAKRMTETTRIQAKTIHRLLEYDPISHGFKRGLDEPLDVELVIIDEASMIDIVLMNNLLKAIPSKAGLVLVGDIDQLPSVGPGAVLANLIASDMIPTIRLTEIFRQAATSQIIVNAHAINQGRMPNQLSNKEKISDFYFIPAKTPEEIYEKLKEVLINRIPERFGYNPRQDIQILSPMNLGGLGVRSLNIELQKELNPNAEPRIQKFGWTFSSGDKVIQTINNYDKEVFNGDIGTIVNINLDENVVQIDFDRRVVPYMFSELDEIALAYAITIHKSQGSEYPVVIIPLATQHYMLLERNLLYTGVTRGKNLVVIIGQTRALSIAVKNQRSRKRITNLIHHLKSF